MLKSLIFFILLYSLRAGSQGLLVNGGFEDINICTEYDAACAPEAWMSSSAGFNNYYKDAGRAHSGTNCMSIEAANFRKPYSRTFLRSRLLCGLRSNSLYNIEFFVKSPYPLLDSIGVLFAGADPLYSAIPRGAVPDVYLQGMVSPSSFGDSAWRKVSFTYRARGDEVFFVVGYFGKADYKGKRVKEQENSYYIFIDDLTMVPLDPQEHLCAGWLDAKEEIYHENERHEMLTRKIRYYRSKPPPPVQLERNAYTVIDTLLLPDILFETGKAVLHPGSFALLDSIARAATGKTVDSLVIKGHTDNTGSGTMNEMLSYNRARTVADYMAPRISRKRVPVFIYGLADRMPVADNRSAGGKQKNRRVEILLYVRE